MQACMEPPEYDAVQIRKKYLLRPLTVTSRTIQIVGLLGSFGFEVRHQPTRSHAHVRASLATSGSVRVRHCVVRAQRTLTRTWTVGGAGWARCWGTS
jgi:formamidopyrimidine-DNA glycosylase